jgi:hypothetical protein
VTPHQGAQDHRSLAEALTWTRRSLLSTLRARDEATLRTAIRQILRALLTSPARRQPVSRAPELPSPGGAS